jgi:hypothetical protein
MNIQNHNHQTMHGNNPKRHIHIMHDASCIITSVWRRCYKIGSRVGSIQVFIIKKKTLKTKPPKR